jgi:hypothetical protein
LVIDALVLTRFFATLQGTAPPYTGRNVGKTSRRSTGRGNFSPSLPTIKHDKSGVIKHYLSMGHRYALRHVSLPAVCISSYFSPSLLSYSTLFLTNRIQVLNYDPSYDTIEIVHYNRKSAQNDPMNVYTYMFLLYSKATEVSFTSEDEIVRVVFPTRFSNQGFTAGLLENYPNV